MYGRDWNGSERTAAHMSKALDILTMVSVDHRRIPMKRHYEEPVSKISEAIDLLEAIQQDKRHIKCNI